MGTAFFTVDLVHPRPEGHLWWRRWSAPFHLVDGHVWGDAEVTSTWDPSGRPGEEHRANHQAWGEGLRQLLDDADRGVFTWLDQQWQLEWLDDDELSVFREAHRHELDE